MLASTRGIIFRATKYSETSLICDIYTEKFGLTTYIIHGVRKAKAKVSADIMRLMSIVDMEIYYQEQKKINRIKEISLNYIYQQLPFDVMRGSVGLLMTEVARKSIREVAQNRELFAFLSASYQLLDTIETSLANFHLAFLTQLTQYLGIRPYGKYKKEASYFDYKEGTFVDSKPEHTYYFNLLNSKILYTFLDIELKDCAALPLNGKLRRSFLEDLLRHYRYHIENFPTINSHSVLQEVWKQ